MHSFEERAALWPPLVYAARHVTVEMSPHSHLWCQ